MAASRASSSRWFQYLEQNDFGKFSKWINIWTTRVARCYVGVREKLCQLTRLNENPENVHENRIQIKHYKQEITKGGAKSSGGAKQG